MSVRFVRRSQSGKDDKEDSNSGRKIDIIWSIKSTDLEFSVGEVSGPLNQHNEVVIYEMSIPSRWINGVEVGLVLRSAPGMLFKDNNN
nr:5887_t:CDS:2 [Entrophospora candida]